LRELRKVGGRSRKRRGSVYRLRLEVFGRELGWEEGVSIEFED